MKRFWLLVMISSFALAGCTQIPISPPGSSPLTGTWRSHFAEVTLSAQGGSIQFSCASGAINAPVILNAQGEFSVDGTYTQGSGVAPPPGSEPTPKPVVYSGKVSSNTLTFSYQTQGGSISGPFTVVRDSSDKVIFCA